MIDSDDRIIENHSNFSSAMILAAVGAVISTSGFVLMTLLGSAGFPPSVTQWLSMIGLGLWGGGCIAVGGACSEGECRRSFRTMGVMLLVLLGLMLILMLSTHISLSGSVSSIIRRIERSYKSIMVLSSLTSIYFIVMQFVNASACNRLDDYGFEGAFKARTGFRILGISIIVFVGLLIFISILVASSVSSSGSISSAASRASNGMDIVLVLFVLMVCAWIVAAIYATIGWIRLASWASSLAGESGQEKSASITYYESAPVSAEPTRPVSMPYTSYSSRVASRNDEYMPSQPKSAATAPVNPIIKAQLKRKTDEELVEIAIGGAMYTPESVAAANEILAERAARLSQPQTEKEPVQEAVEAKPEPTGKEGSSDEELLAIMADPIEYSAEELNAASIELFHRRTSAFVDEVAANSAETLRAIVANPDSYPVGTVMMAKELLEKQ